MKPAYKFLLSAAAMLTAVACSNDFEDEANVPSYSGPVKTINVDAMSADNDSRTVIGEPNDGKYSVTWSATGECVALAEFYGETTTITKTDFDCYESEEDYGLINQGRQARFRFQIRDDLEQTYNSFAYHALYPGSALVSFSATEAQFTLPAEQTAVLMENTATKDGGDEDHPAAYEYKPDPNASVLVATVQQKDARADDGNNKLTLKFNHAAAYTRLRIYNLAGNTDVKSVKVTAADAVLAGNGTYTYPVGEDAATISGDESGAKSVTLTADNLKTDDNGQLVVWMATLPAKLTTSFTVDVTTGNDLVFTKTVDLEGQSKTVSLEAGNITKLAVDMLEGDYMIVASNANGNEFYAFSSVKTTTGSRLQTSEKSATLPTYADDEAYIWHISKVKNTNTYYISNEYVEGNAKYLSWTTGSNNAVLSATGYALTITPVSGTDYMYIKSAATPERRLQKNSGDNAFAFYTTSQQGNLYLVPAVLKLMPKITGDFKVDPMPATDEDEFTLKFKVLNVNLDEPGNHITVEAYKTNEAKEGNESDWLLATLNTEGQSPDNEYELSYMASDPNETESTRTAYIVITATNENGTVEQTIEVKQDYVRKETVYFVKVTKVEELGKEGNYLIVYENGNVAFDGSRDADNNKLDATFNTIDVTIEEDKIECNTTNENNYFTIEASGSSYTIKSASGYYIGHTGSSNGLNTNTSPYTNTISFTNGEATIESGGYYLRFNSAKDQTRFRYFKDGQQAVHLYRLGGAAEIEDAAPTSVTLEPSEVTFAATESGNVSAKTVTVKADGFPYPEITVENKPDWLNVDVVDGYKLQLYPTTENESTEALTGTVTVKAENSSGSAKATLSVTQSGAVGGDSKHAMFDFPKDLYSSATSSTSVNGVAHKVNAITATFDKKSGSDPMYYPNTGNEGVRMYANNILTISGDAGVTITKIVFTSPSGYSGVLTPSSGSISSDYSTWTGSESSVVFTNTNTSQRRIVTIDVTYVVDESYTPEPATPELTITGDDTVSVDAEGGERTIYYTVTNPVSGQSVSATASEAWVSNIKYTDSAVTFTVAKNETTSDREATVTLTYPGAASKSVTVKQAAASGGETEEPEAGYESDEIFVCTAGSTQNPGGLGTSTFNGETATGFKLGSGSAPGSFESGQVGITGNATLTLYGVAWKDKTAALQVSVNGGGSVVGTAQYSLRADAGATSNAPFTITVTDEDKYTFNLTGLNANSTITFTSVKGTDQRVVVAGVHLTSTTGGGDGGSTTDPTDPDPEEPDQPETHGEYICDFANMSSQASAGTSSYTSGSFKMNTSDGSWTITNGNNNGKGWSFVKFGQKSNTNNTGTIATDFAATAAVTTVTTNVQKLASAATTTVKLIVATDSSFNNTVGSYNAQNIVTGDVTFNITNPTPNCYYKLEFFSNNSSSTNGSIQVNKVTLTY